LPAASCALDDKPTSISVNRAAVPTAEVVFMSASFLFRQGTFLAWMIGKGAFPCGFLRAHVIEGMLAPFC
jgi:hypothetical protein